MNAGSNTMEQLGSHLMRDGVGERTSILASPPIRIWLMLMLVMFGLGLLGGIMELEQAVATFERSRLLTLFSALSTFFAIFAFTVGQAASNTLTNDGRRWDGRQSGFSERPVSAYAANDDYAAAYAENSGAATQQSYNDGDDEDFTEYFDVAGPPTYDPLATRETGDSLPGTGDTAQSEPAPTAAKATASSSAASAPPVALSTGSGPSWLLILDDYMSRPISRRTVMIAVAASSSVCAFATWHWVGRIGETLTALIGVAVLSALFSRVTQMAAQSRQVVDDLRHTNNRLVQEVVHRRVREQRTGGDSADRWASTIDFDSMPLHDLEALRTKFLNEVSHELRGPITAINLAARIIMKHHVYDHDVVERFGSTIVVEGDRLAQIVNDFLELAKIESGCIAWNDDRVEPADIITSAIFAAESVAGECEVKLQANTEVDLPPLVADRDRVVEALTILVIAALRRAPKESTVTVHARRGAGETLFAVEDQGTGKREEKTFNIFGNPSSQGATASEDDPDGQDSGGQGLGLCIASEIAAHYGGEMWAEGRVGEGAAFVLSIPDEAPLPSQGETEQKSPIEPKQADVEAKSDEPGEGAGDDTQARVQALAELDKEAPATQDTEAPVLLTGSTAPGLPTIFAPATPSAESSNALGGTTTDTVGTETAAVAEAEHAPAEEADSLGGLDAEPDADLSDSLLEPVAVVDAYDATSDEMAPWDAEFEQPCASEQMSLQELDDVLYGRTQVKLVSDDSEDSEEPEEEKVEAIAPDESQAANGIESSHLTEVKRGFGFSVHRNEDLQHLDDDSAGVDATPTSEEPAAPTDSSSENTVDDSFDAWLRKAEAEKGESATAADAQDTAAASEDGTSLDSALAQLERSTAQLGSEVASRETDEGESDGSEDHSEPGDEASLEEAEAASSDSGTDQPSARAAAGRAPRHDPRKPQGGWQLASRIGASVVRRTPHRS